MLALVATARSLKSPDMSLPRLIEPEWLDELPPTDPRAVRSRADLRRVNIIMNNAGILQDCLGKYWTGAAPKIITELGAGDGTFMLALARRFAHKWRSVKVRLIDRQSSMSASTEQAFQDLGWTAEYITADVFAWMVLAQARTDIIICNLFLHHLQPQSLESLLILCAQKSILFTACEPARTRLALYGSHMLGVIGCNYVTRHDAVASVHAGFQQYELSHSWPQSTTGVRSWQLHEHDKGLFNHVFVAQQAAKLSRA